MDDRTEEWVEAYSPSLLRWALNKTGCREQAEVLSQEVWLQFFSAIHREEQAGRNVENAEHFLRRIAKYVWCKHLRDEKYHRLPDVMEHRTDADFSQSAADEDERQQLIRWLHQRILCMSRQQREVIIMACLQQLPHKEIARRLCMSESAVRWHLFDSRHKLKEEKKIMDKIGWNNLVYHPGRLHLAISGDTAPEMAINRINQDLLMQNILLTCAKQKRSTQEIASILGVAGAYVEHALEYLIRNELITEEKGRYATAFIIHTHQYEKEVLCVFERYKENVSCRIVRHLMAQEQTIRALGFTSCEKPMDKLLWLLIYHFTRFLSLPCKKPEPPFRPDGGRYWVLGFDKTDAIEQEEWANNGSMHKQGFFWFGLYNFGSSEIEELMDARSPQWHALRSLLEKLIAQNFRPEPLTSEEQYHLALLIDKGFLISDNEKLSPSFVVFTKAQYERLKSEVFQPLADALQPALLDLTEEIGKLSLHSLPTHLQSLCELDQAMALMNIASATEQIAFREGYLYQPDTSRDGEFLTMAYVMPA